MAKIAKVDSEAMDSLYASELEKAGSKVAAGRDENGQPSDIQAFKDHEEYKAVLADAMKADKSLEVNANDVIKD